MKEAVALKFEVITQLPERPGHSKFRTEGTINTGLEAHLKTCAECRATIATDLRDFAKQIEDMR
jgi:hypothetical protein